MLIFAGSLALALVASGFNALSSVMQRKANIGEADNDRFGVKLLIRLLRNPAWLIGVVSMLISFLLQATALGMGPLAAVEPMLVLELPLTLLLGSRVLAHPLHRRDWLSSVVMAAGLALMIGVLAPSGDVARHAALARRAGAVVVAVVAVAAVVLIGQFVVPRARAALFGAAAGAGFGVTASLMKLAVTHLEDGGVVGLFTAWETYGMAVAGITSIILVQAALHAGTLVAAQPGITLLDPLVSIVWGTIVLGESVRQGPILAVAALGAAAIVAAAFALVRATERAHAGGS